MMMIFLASFTSFLKELPMTEHEGVKKNSYGGRDMIILQLIITFIKFTCIL